MRFVLIKAIATHIKNIIEHVIEIILNVVDAQTGGAVGALLAYISSPLFAFNIISFVFHTVGGALIGWLIKRFLDKYFKHNKNT